MVAQKKNPNNIERYRLKKKILGSTTVIGMVSDRTRYLTKNQVKQSRFEPSENSVQAGLHRTTWSYRSYQL